MATIKNGYAVVEHGGVGEPLHYTDGCNAAAAAAVSHPDNGKDALAAAVAAVASPENDGRCKAGATQFARVMDWLDKERPHAASEGRPA